MVFPGGFGTIDEFFELLTLIQTGKIKKRLLLIVYDEKYWSNIINFEGLINNGVVSKADMNNFSFCNSVEEAFIKIKTHFEKHYLTEKMSGGTELSLK